MAYHTTPSRPSGASDFTITSAYNFVPLQSTVVQPEWQHELSQDLPLRQGLCAELEIEIQAHTPLMVGGSHEKSTSPVSTVSFHTHPDGVPAIPGSSLRGMLRNVLEIATYSRMSLIDDRALSLRDLDLDAYTNTFKQKTRAGWLSFDAERQSWKIEERAVHFIDHKEIERIRLSFADGTKKSMYSEIFSAWKKCGEDQKRMARTKYRVAGSKLAIMYGLDESIHRGKLKNVKLEGKEKGHLVFTGQPGSLDEFPENHRKHNKHTEFVFDFKTIKTWSVADDVIRQFRQIHEQSEDLKYLESEESPHKARGIPVFFLVDSKNSEKISCLGLSMLFRLPGAQTLGEMARKRQAARSALDFVETLFGHIEAEGASGARKGRISFSDCRWHASVSGKPQLADEKFQRETILAQPKPSFYPSYLKQTGGKEYSTILTPTAQLQGWKRYPVRPLSEVALNEPPTFGAASNTRLKPLAPGNRFRGCVRLHNVMPEELGAVIWALTWDRQSDLRHALGMGKPFGFGQISITVKGEVRSNDENSPEPSLEDCLADFKHYMQSKVSGWEKSQVMTELLTMANPALPQATKEKLRPLKLAMQGENGFKEAKKRAAKLSGYSSLGK